MQCSDKVGHRPYHPANDFGAENCPYIVRIAPDETSFRFEWIPQKSQGPVTLYYGERGSGVFQELPVSAQTVTVSGLKTEVDYEFYLQTANGQKSRVRLVRTGKNPENAVVINYLHPEDEQYAFSGRYLCSPSFVRLSSGRLVASMDVYGPNMAQNLMLLFYSEDNGVSWHYLTDLYPFYWGTLFVESNTLYCIGNTTEYGNLQIACSSDGGVRWSAPVTIFYGSNLSCPNGGVHHPPMQLVHHNGRIWMPTEYGSWNRGSHLPAVFSIKEGDDLMNAENWHVTGFLPFEGEWKKDAEGVQKDTMEGSLIVSPDGTFYEYLRWDVGKALRLKINADDPDALPEYDRLMEMPVSNSMFKIVPYQGRYLMATNRKKEGYEYGSQSPRHLLSLFESKDLENWTLLTDVIDRSDAHPAQVGFQYPFLITEGKQVLLMIRSAYNGAHSYHDSNYMLFVKETLQ